MSDETKKQYRFQIGMWAIVFAVGVGAAVGWILAHDVVGRECTKLKGFFIGERTFTCALKADEHADG